MGRIDYIELITSCLDGNKESVEILIRSIQQNVYNLSIRYLWNPMDAEDATQEILLKVLTNLSSFRGRSSFTTWVYRIATNYLLNMKRTQIENLTFEEGAYHLKVGLTYPAYEKADTKLLEEEVKIACSTSMLICVSRPLRLVYLIGEILEFDSKEGSFILDIKREIETIMDAAAIFHSHPNYSTPESVLSNIKSWLNNGNFPLLTSQN